MTHPLSSPAALFSAHARAADTPAGPVPRRLKSPLDYLADVDGLGASLSRHPRLDYWGWTCGERTSPRAGRTVADAARDCAMSHGLSATVPVVEWWRVSAWLAEALELRGEIVRRATDGVCLWGCTEPDFAPDASPVVLDVYLSVRGAFALQHIAASPAEGASI